MRIYIDIHTSDQQRHRTHVLTATQGSDYSPVVSWSPEPFLKRLQLQHIAQEQACAKILQTLMLDKDLCSEHEASDPKYT